jgi:hypothetical protein
MRTVIEIAGTLRRGQRRVVQLLVKGSEQTVVSNALQVAQVQGAKALIVVGAPGMDQDHVAFFTLGGQDGRRNGRPHRPVMKKLSRAAVLGAARARPRRKEST